VNASLRTFGDLFTDLRERAHRFVDPEHVGQLDRSLPALDPTLSERILHHLRNNVEDSKNTVMIVGYQAEHTLGRRIVEKRKEIKIFGESHKLKAEVVVMNYFSAHADEPGILDFTSKLDRERLQTVFLVHGDLERQEILSGAMNEAGYSDIAIPARGESVTL